MKRRLADLPLHTGQAPAYLFKRMVKLAGAITMAVVDAYGPMEMLHRLSDPWWFQAFGCVLGFDWHSSGLTTVTCGAMKEAGRQYGDDLGILVAGGKGGVSRKTPQEIDAEAQRLAITGGDRLIYASRMSAKVDSAAVQDGYQVYHHSFFFTPAGQWCVVQQGMNEARGWARRYHWLGEHVADFVCEPHEAIHDPRKTENPSLFDPDPGVLNMVALEAGASRTASAALVRENADSLLDRLDRATEGPTLFAPAHHLVLPADVNLPRLKAIVQQVHERQPKDFEALLGSQGVGPAAIRSLALIAEIIYDAPACHRDPAALPPPPESPPEWSVSPDEAPIAGPFSRHLSPMRKKWADYSYAHGGKDGTPFPVDRAAYDRNIGILTDAVRRARLGDTEKTEALRRLARA